LSIVDRLVGYYLKILFNDNKNELTLL